MDVGTRWAAVRLDGAPAEPLGPPGASLAEALLRRGAVGAAAEMLGAARRALDLSVAHARVREQFGQPIGSFQAVRHRLAEMLLAVENAYTAVYYAAWAVDAAAPDAGLAASVAKTYVAEAAWKACGDAIQVHGGIGFTWEYDLHLYAKRVRALAALYGDGDHHRELIVRHRYHAVLVAINDRYWRAPESLPGDTPITNAISDGGFAKTMFFRVSRHYRYR
jgi:alkylation response protein AidB-like acyl-CoA dehydrogenase